MRVRMSLVALLIAANTSVASAALGGDAARGDNCTPFNSYKIGYSLPSGTIIDQRVVLVGGWQLAGWLLTTAPNTLYYLPSPRYFDHAIDEFRLSSMAPAFVPVRSEAPADLDRAYSEARTLLKDYSRNIDSYAPTRLPSDTIVGKCFAEALQVR